MIGKLKGIVDSIGDDWAIVDVGGVGYLVHCSARTLGAFPQPGAPISLSIETYVREDQIKLFGFDSASERDWFRLLGSVQGVGTKVALAILGIVSPDELAASIALGDKTPITRAAGVGPKLAARIVSELKDKPLPMATTLAKRAATPQDQSAMASSDAISALINLGYAQAQAAGAVAAASRDLEAGATAAALIRAGLKELAQ